MADSDFGTTLVKAVIFDLDGVICNTEPLHVRSWQVLFARKGIHVPESRIWAGVGISDLDMLKQWFQEFSITDDIHSWEVEKRNIYLMLLQQDVPEFPGAVNLVKRLSWNWPLGLASSAWRAAVEISLRKLAIRSHFQVLVAKEDVASHKPSPEPYLTAAANLGVRPAHCVAIEDSPAGITAAKQAGMACIAVTNSFSADRLSEADFVIGSLDQTAPIFAFLTGRKE